MSYGARCRGYQHYAALVGNVGLIKIVKLVGRGDIFEDLYTSVGVAWLKVLSQPQKRSISKSNVSIRRIVKFHLLSSLYGESPYWVSRHLVPRRLGVDIAEKLISVTNDFVGNLSQVSQSLAAAILNKDNNACVGGVWVDMNCYRRFKHKVSAGHLGYRVRFSSRLITTEVSVEETKANLLSNVIHVLDALHMRLIINNRTVPLFPLHDCILLEAKDFKNLMTLPVECYSDIYRGGKCLNSIWSNNNAGKANVDNFLRIVGPQDFRVSFSQQCFRLRN